jgi:hypothetical protein
MFYSPLEYFMAMLVIWYIFPPFWYIVPGKIWQPWWSYFQIGAIFKEPEFQRLFFFAETNNKNYNYTEKLDYECLETKEKFVARN